MYRYLNINSWSVPTLAGLTVGMLIMQIVLPLVVFGMEETSLPPEEQPAEEIIVEEPEEILETVNFVSEDSEEEGVNEEDVDEEVDTPTNIDTGDAVAGLEVENEINFNEIDMETPSTTETSSDEDDEPGATQTEEELNEEPDPEIIPISENSDPLIVSATNTATTTTNATTTATTGNNNASGTDSSINTGDAIAYTDVLNVVNTNIVNSDGLVKFVNETLGFNDFDLRDEFDLTYAEFDTSESTPNCNLNTCNEAEDLTVNTDSTALINNNIIVEANTGENETSGDNSNINTGDAYASANVINVANTNITDSNYLLLVFNNFSDYAGDILLPNSSFFDEMLQNSNGINNAEIDITNSATINNDVDLTADSGNNTTDGNNGTITTGSASAMNDTTNIVNQNIIGGSSFNMLIRVHGDWSGSITGLPEGLTWYESDRGIEITSENSGAKVGASNLTQSSNNNAIINNNVQVFALTGDNKSEGAETDIKTGDAYADSSILNIANTNVIGSNWSHLIFTIYGNWTGDLSFGQPNLWLGITADSPDQPIMPDSEITYTYTVFNRGDSTAPNVKLESIFETGALQYNNYDSQYTEGLNTKNVWELGDIARGETREFTHTTRAGSELDHSVVTAIPLTSRVSSTQNDADESDNEEIVTVYVGERRSSSNSASKTFPAKFDIIKTASRDLAQPGDIVEYEVSFFNRGGQLYDALLVDTLVNEDGEIIQQQSWPLGEIKNWETIDISYDIEFDSAMATGTYTNTAQLIGFHESRKKKNQVPYESSIASHSLGLGTIAEGMVLGISDSICSPYLTDYMRYGRNNSYEEVIKLQQFLGDHLDRSLDVSGHFDLTTEQAVRDFQQKYRSEILTPWGLEKDSGYVYYTTQKKINEIMCNNTIVFALDPNQENEIRNFRNRIENTRDLSYTSNTNHIPMKEPEEEVAALTPPPPNPRVAEKPEISKPTPPKAPEIVPSRPTTTIESRIINWWNRIIR